MVKVFCGRKWPLEPGRLEVWLNGRAFLPTRSNKVATISANGFEWGYQGQGALQLALALLLETFGSVRTANYWYRQLGAQVVANLAPEWVLTDEDLKEWYAVVKPENLNNGESADGETGSVARGGASGEDITDPGANAG